MLGKSGEIQPERMMRLSQRGNDTQLWMCLVVKVKSDALKKQEAAVGATGTFIIHLSFHLIGKSTS